MKPTPIGMKSALFDLDLLLGSASHLPGDTMRSSWLVFLSGLCAVPSILNSQTLASAGAGASDGDTPKCRKACVALFADGNVRGAVVGDDGATTASGSLGMAISRPLSDLSVLINVASKGDTIRRGYGTSIVAPGSGGALNAGLVDYRRRSYGGRGHGHGWHVYGSVASARWATDTTAEGVITGTTDVAFLGIGVLRSYEIIRGEVEDNTVFAALDYGIAYRGLFGDIATSSNDDLKEALYGSKRERWVGLEIGLAIQTNFVKGGINYYFFDGRVRGLTDGQVVAGFSLQANVFQGQIK